MSIIFVIGFYLLALIFLILHLKLKDKDLFLLSVSSILIGSILFNLVIVGDLKYVGFIIAIGLSLVGDLFMAKKIKIFDERLINGIIAFGMAHLAYIFAFTELRDYDFQMWYLIVTVLLFGSLYPIFIYSSSQPRKINIATFWYALIISVLFLTILQFTFSSNHLGASAFAMLGITFFIISDTMIAYENFAYVFPRSSELIAITYILSQLCLQSVMIAIEG